MSRETTVLKGKRFITYRGLDGSKSKPRECGYEEKVTTFLFFLHNQLVRFG